MTRSHRPSRALLRAGPASLAGALVLGAVLLSAAGATLAADASPASSPDPAGSPTTAGSPLPAGSAAHIPGPSASPGAWPSILLDVVFQPLPAVVAEIPSDIPTVSVEPESEARLEVGVAYPHALGHCGLLSPIDLDGSLWQPVGGVDATGGSIDSDEEVGELINATEGTFTMVDTEAAELRTAGGSLIELRRAAGALDYPLCM